jgi:hypothetical protein
MYNWYRRACYAPRITPSAVASPIPPGSRAHHYRYNWYQARPAARGGQTQDTKKPSLSAGLDSLLEVLDQRDQMLARQLGIKLKFLDLPLPLPSLAGAASSLARRSRTRLITLLTRSTR